MELIAVNIWDMFTNLKGFLDQLIAQYHSFVYLVLFFILFCETGLVLFPFLPGDSLLFTAGAFAAMTPTGPGPLELRLLLPILCAGPILGDSVNYWIGRFVGPKIFHKENVRFLNKRHLDEAHAFYQRHGGKAVAIGRFLPIIRTFTPLVAGIGKMPYPRFLAFSITGTVAWINLCILAGYFLSQNTFVQKHFEVIIAAIVVVSLLPAFYGFMKSRSKKPKEAAKPVE